MGNEPTCRPPATVLVWDRGVRLFHWLLVAAVAGAAWTGFFGAKSTLDLHLIAAAVIVALVLHRLVWGLLGSTHARFRNFMPSPLHVLRHAAALVRGQAPVELGHNPLGAVMILALLLALSALAVTGLAALGGVLKDGPLAPVMPFDLGVFSRRIHELMAYALLGLVALHVAGVVIESVRTRENLVGSMVHGQKRPREEAHAAVIRTAHPWLAAALTSSMIVGATAVTAHHSLKPGLGVPQTPLDTAYAKECGSCHTPHHPSLAPAATWARIMAGLDDHFGDNAGMAADVAQPIAAYLAANSAERWDTEAANLLRRRNERDPLRITATPGWQKLHERVPEAAFKAKTVAGRLNCSQCHADAEAGRFLPRQIRLPVAAGETSSTPEKTP